MWSLDNFGATYTSTGLGTTITANVLANTKGDAVQVISGAALTDDVYAFSLLFIGGTGSAGSYMFDLQTDPAGGTAWTTRINNLVVCGNSSYQIGGQWYYFPYYIKAGTAIACRMQATTGSLSMQACIRVFGRPSRPDLVKTGSLVETFNAATTTTFGTTAVVPGTNAMGSNTASLGTITGDKWWWQAGFTMNDSIRAGTGVWFDVLAGDGTDNVVCCENLMHSEDTTAERGGRSAIGSRIPYRNVASGKNIYARAACNGTPESNNYVIVYALGG